MTGYLMSKGFRISEKNIVKSVDPDSYDARRNNTLDRTNPVPYQPLYFGHKLHVDQNEKLINFWSHICNGTRWLLRKNNFIWSHADQK